MGDSLSLSTYWRPTLALGTIVLGLGCRLLSCQQSSLPIPPFNSTYSPLHAHMLPLNNLTIASVMNTGHQKPSAQ
ncbi:hypothetical protein BDV10DRAFT_158348 [Aspergillus recurvatus]